MKKFWKLVSKKDLLFGILIFAVVIGMGIYDSTHKVAVSFTETYVEINVNDYSMNIPFELIYSISLTQMPDRGSVVDGSDDMQVRTGIWNNETWGEYYVCANLNSTSCIVTELTDGRIFVFTASNNKKTESAYDTLMAYLDP